VMAFFTVNTVDTETEGDLEKTATPSHPSRSMRRRGEDATHFSTPVNTLANRRMMVFLLVSLHQLNQRQPLAHRGGLSISASVPLRKHRQLPDSAPQDRLNAGLKTVLTPPQDRLNAGLKTVLTPA
ncbi:hypothetical protein KUCAC02_035780, partial [Chaenocephalus aceratus]